MLETVVKRLRERSRGWLIFFASWVGMVVVNPAFAQSESLPPLPTAWWLVPIGSLIALGFAYVFYKSVMRQGEGTDVMQEIAQAVREGAMAYLRQQYKVVGVVFAVLMRYLPHHGFRVECPKPRWCPSHF